MGGSGSKEMSFSDFASTEKNTVSNQKNSSKKNSKEEKDKQNASSKMNSISNNIPQSSLQKEQTDQDSYGGRLINILGVITAHLIFQVI